MSITRQQQLQKNFSRMFWIQALQNIGLTNMLGTLFYLHRSLTLVEVFYMSIIWSVTNLIFEVPSSYLADYWSRKKTIILGIGVALVGDIIFIFSHQFYIFAIAMFFTALQFAMFSGTDEALIYDSAKELGNEEKSLVHLSSYISGRNFFKIATPLIAAVIAKDLLDWQFVFLILCEAVACLISLIFAFRVVEPEHFFKVEQEEAHILHNAISLIKSDITLVKAILTKVVIFIAMFVIWRFHQDYFLHLGISVVELGLIWTSIQLLIFVNTKYVVGKISHSQVFSWVNNINLLLLFFIIIDTAFIYFGVNKWYIIICTALIFTFEACRWPLYSQIFNQKSASFNRSTLISLANFLKSILDLPLLFIGSILVGVNILYPFIFSLVLTLLVYVGARFTRKDLQTV